MNLAFKTEYIFDEGSIKRGKEPRIGDYEPSLDYRSELWQIQGWRGRNLEVELHGAIY